jgi:hypothetical protein
VVHTLVVPGALVIVGLVVAAALAVIAVAGYLTAGVSLAVALQD